MCRYYDGTTNNSIGIASVAHNIEKTLVFGKSLGDPENVFESDVLISDTVRDGNCIFK